MALVENKKSEVMENSEDKQEIFYRVYPDMKRQIDYEEKEIKFEISLPGVDKKNIKLKALPNWFHIAGSRGHMEYSANQSFGDEIIPEKTKAKYSNGLLTITAFIRDPMDEAVEVVL